MCIEVGSEKGSVPELKHEKTKGSDLYDFGKTFKISQGLTLQNPTVMLTPNHPHHLSLCENLHS